MNRPTDHWGDLLVHVVTSKLDLRTIKEWENTIDSAQVPTFTDFIEFLKRRCQTLEAVEKIGDNNVTGPSLHQSSQHKVNSCNVAISNVKCTYCQGEHNVYSCKEFKHLTVNERLKHAKVKGLCLNCLRGKHLAKDCISRNYKICNKRHNSLLHIENNDKSESKPKQDHKEIIRKIRNNYPKKV